ncbi:hypothetical protein [Streptomyces sp. NPDC057496]|uniref:hypothetical protein n=1 Tax=Streptomyces sp. NPDC057496 TaxID=3346149 RepID=UPI00367CD32C
MNLSFQKSSAPEENQSKGRAKDFDKGFAEGFAETLLALLEARGIAITDEVRKQIETCYDLPLLRQWLIRAATATTAEEVFTTDRCPTCGAAGQVVL